MFAFIHIETMQVLAVGTVQKTFGGDWGWLQQEGKAVWREMPPDTDVGEVLITLPEPGNPVLTVDETKKKKRTDEEKAKADAKALLLTIDWDKVKTLDDLKAIVRALVER